MVLRIFEITLSSFENFLKKSFSPALVVFFSLQHYQQGQDFTDILMFLNIAFTVLYIVEAGLKFIALRLVGFFFCYAVRFSLACGIEKD